MQFISSGTQIRPFVPSRTLGDFLTAPTNARPGKLQKTSEAGNVITPAATEQKTDPVHQSITNNPKPTVVPNATTPLNKTIDLTNTTEMMDQA